MRHVRPVTQTNALTIESRGRHSKTKTIERNTDSIRPYLSASSQKPTPPNPKNHANELFPPTVPTSIIANEAHIKGPPPEIFSEETRGRGGCCGPSPKASYDEHEVALIINRRMGWADAEDEYQESELVHALLTWEERIRDSVNSTPVETRAMRKQLEAGRPKAMSCRTVGTRKYSGISNRGLEIKCADIRRVSQTDNKKCVHETRSARDFVRGQHDVSGVDSFAPSIAAESARDNVLRYGVYAAVESDWNLTKPNRLSFDSFIDGCFSRRLRGRIY